MELRPNQVGFVDDIRSAFRSNRRVLGVAPTGFGKTAVFSFITSEVARRGKHITILAHREEIVDQISIALDRFNVRHGRIQPGHVMTDDHVQVGMVQTVARRLDRVVEPDLLVLDEAHHAIAGTWKTVCAVWQKCRLLGVTATPRRLDGQGLGDAFDHMVVGPTVAELIAGRFLAAFDYLAPPVKADLSSIKSARSGDFNVDELADAMDKAVITGDAVSHYRSHLAGRPAIAFCVKIAHAEHVAEQFRAAGYQAASVDGKLDKRDRRDRIAAIGDGRLNVLTTCDIISEGTDIPSVAGEIQLNPTQSEAKFLQQAGRVLRPKPDGSRALILDHVGNVYRHGLPDAPRQWTLDRSKPKKDDSLKTATCDACFQVFMVEPGWRRDPCEDEPKCLFAESEAISKPDLEVVEGTLEVITQARIDTIRATPLHELLTGRESRADLEEIRKAKNYHPRWTHHIIMQRKRAVVAA